MLSTLKKLAARNRLCTAICC